ncbi:hypothetical protein [Ureaplasma parvum]|uniref:hypothetical protein n=1 Tax=Ureaplasma parvum TaxID=134821 RepID=UPI00307F4C25
MKISDFNKLGGTEYRIEIQTDGYFQIINWYIEKIENFGYSENIRELDLDFKNWIKNAEFSYNYDSGKINRLAMIFSNFKKWGILNKDNEFINLYELKKYNNDPISLFFHYISKNYDPFKKMIDFLWNKKGKNEDVNYKNFWLAFFICEENDNFEELYNIGYENLIKYLSKELSMDILNDDSKNICSNFRKPPKFKEDYEKISDKIKNKNSFFKEEDFSEDFIKNEKYIKWIIRKQKTKLTHYLNNVDYQKFVQDFQMAKLLILLEDEYLDLFSRWMREFKFINSKDDEFMDLNFLRKKGNEYYIDFTFIDINYPYSMKEVEAFLKNINEEKFSFKKNDDNLKNINNSTLAEYFVNLYMAYKLNINPKDFNKYSYTKMSYDLYPKFTAPGGTSDFVYVDKNEEEIYFVETTIHRSESQVLRNELEPTCRHFDTYLKESQNLVKSKKYLYIVSFINSPKNEWFKQSYNSLIKSTLEYIGSKENSLEILNIKSFASLID